MNKSVEKKMKIFFWNASQPTKFETRRSLFRNFYESSWNATTANSTHAWKWKTKCQPICVEIIEWIAFWFFILWMCISKGVFHDILHRFPLFIPVLHQRKCKMVFFWFGHRTNCNTHIIMILMKYSSAETQCIAVWFIRCFFLFMRSGTEIKKANQKKKQHQEGTFYWIRDRTNFDKRIEHVVRLFHSMLRK